MSDKSADINPVKVKRGYSVQSLAARWGCSADTVRRLIEAGRLEALNVATSPRRPRFAITAEAVERFEEENAVETTKPERPVRRRRRRAPIEQKWIV